MVYPKQVTGQHIEAGNHSQLMGNLDLPVSITPNPSSWGEPI